jgi:hypothetical protein
MEGFDRGFHSQAAAAVGNQAHQTIATAILLKSDFGRTERFKLC